MIAREPAPAREPERDDDEGEIPAFLLPFLEEHVCAVESQAARDEENATWTHVASNRGSQPGTDAHKHSHSTHTLCLLFFRMVGLRDGQEAGVFNAVSLLLHSRMCGGEVGMSASMKQ